MNSESHAAGSKSSFARAGALAAVLVMLGCVLLGVQHLTRDEPRPDSTRQVASSTPSVPQPVPVPPPVSQDYVGSAACRECHHEIWDRYQTHPMAQSLGRVGDVHEVEDYSRVTHFDRGGREYYIERAADAVWHHERQADNAGETIYDQAVAVQYAIGSGKRGRSYVIDRGGLLFLSPISWYSEMPRWDLAPGYPEQGHLRFERRVVDRCISCHAGRVAPDPGWADHFQQPAIVEAAIGCERCHGPAGEHVAGRRREPAANWIDPIVNPSRLSPQRRESVCNQCHLHGDVEILRYGRGEFDFRPGMHVAEVWSFLMTHKDRDSQMPKAVSQVQQMYDSACSGGSSGRLSCTSCHDPHYSPAETEKPAFYREKCLRCHTAESCRERPERRHATGIADSCVACHMPRLGASDVPHTTQTDHRVPKRRGEAHVEPHSTPNLDGFPEIFGIAAAPLSALEESRIRGLVAAKSAEEAVSASLARRARQYLEPVNRAAPGDQEVADNLALIRFMVHEDAAAVDLWKGSILVAPAREQTLQSLALAYQKLGRNRDALDCMTRLLEVNPWHARFWEQRSQLEASLGLRQESLSSGLRALELDPSRSELYQTLSQIARSLGNSAEADRLESTARRFKTIDE